MTESHQRILMDTELISAARRQRDESRFAHILGLEEDTSEITINTDNRCIARDEPDFFLGVTYTGNSLLHLAARSNFLDLANKIWRKERSLLVARNKVLETPLHCAAKNGNSEIVSFFIGSARNMGGDTMVELLRTQNKDGETALHEAVRHNHASVAYSLITADPVLASVIDPQGISPLYLAITSGHLDVVHKMIDGLIGIEVSRAYYAGPDGQTAFHAVVLRSKANFSIERSMEMLGACYGARRRDQLAEDHTTKEDAEKENVKLTSAIQTMGLGSVLIATATFAAAFTLPGGNGADYFPKSGWFSQVYKYALKAFLVSDTFAFLFAFQCTMILLVSGVTTSKPHWKKGKISVALWWLILASRWTVISLAIAVFVVLAPFNKLLGFLILFAGCLCRFNVARPERIFLNEVITAREGWDQLYQNKLPEDTLVQRLPAWRRNRISRNAYYIEEWFPPVITAVLPLIMDLVWYIGKLVVTKISRHH